MMTSTAERLLWPGLQRDVEGDAWRAALARAEGAKVYDDPKQLRRTIKAEAKAKEKRQDAWKERAERQKQGMAEKQQKCVPPVLDMLPGFLMSPAGYLRQHGFVFEQHLAAASPPPQVPTHGVPLFPQLT